MSAASTSTDPNPGAPGASIPAQPERTPSEELAERKCKLAAALRVFGRFGFDEGAAGHITARDPYDPEHFWVNPVLRSFKQMRVSDLIKVDDEGRILEGSGALNQAAFAIHSRIHKARPEVVGQLLAEAAGTPILIDPVQVKETSKLTGNPLTGYFSFQPIYDVLVAEEPDFMD